MGVVGTRAHDAATMGSNKPVVGAVSTTEKASAARISVFFQQIGTEFVDAFSQRSKLLGCWNGPVVLETVLVLEPGRYALQHHAPGKQNRFRYTNTTSSSSSTRVLILRLLGPFGSSRRRGVGCCSGGAAASCRTGARIPPPAPAARRKRTKTTTTTTTRQRQRHAKHKNRIDANK
mmetsp:Transcript_2565/g.5527  ORF Transcript_2565/g.5527 Transcript_2565/m.5527 type:complete len:176 (-) Transcript_2565:128-655(-)